MHRPLLSRACSLSPSLLSVWRGRQRRDFLHLTFPRAKPRSHLSTTAARSCLPSQKLAWICSFSFLRQKAFRTQSVLPSVPSQFSPPFLQRAQSNCSAREAKRNLLSSYRALTSCGILQIKTPSGAPGTWRCHCSSLDLRDLRCWARLSFGHSIGISQFRTKRVLLRDAGRSRLPRLEQSLFIPECHRSRRLERDSQCRPPYFHRM